MTLTFDLHRSLPELTLEVAGAFKAAEATALIGPSGSGKTTLLRCLAGLDLEARGRITAAASCWLDTAERRIVPAHRRPVGMVFQHDHLFSDRTVAGNLDYAARRAHRRRTAGALRLTRAAVIERMELGSLLTRAVTSLSGGERRRVALGRALLAEPTWLFLDEPLTGLDGARRGAVLDYLDELRREQGCSIVFVSHQLDEVTRMADQVVMLERGRVTRAGDAQQVLNQLEGEHYARGAVLEGELLDWDQELYLARIAVADTQLAVPASSDPAAQRGDGNLRLFIRAQDVAIALSHHEDMSIRNALPTTIAAIHETDQGPFAEVELRLGEQVLYARITRLAVRTLALEPGQAVLALVKAVSFAHATAGERVAWNGSQTAEETQS
ncbi:MAG: molybdenum ABC transporter ATP-binding protein [Pseudomonadota bacterium]